MSAYAMKIPKIKMLVLFLFSSLLLGLFASVASAAYGTFSVVTDDATNIYGNSALLNGHAFEDGYPVYAGFSLNDSGAAWYNTSVGRIDSYTKYEHHDYMTGALADDTATGAIYGVNWRSQSFKSITSTIFVKGLYLKMYRVGTPGNMVLSIRSTIGGANLYSQTYNMNAITTSTSGAYYIFNFTTYPWLKLVQNTTYYIVVRCLAGDSSNYVKWRQDEGDAITNCHYPRGYAMHSSDSGATWATSNHHEFWWWWTQYYTDMFAVYGAMSYVSLPFSHTNYSLAEDTTYNFTAVANYSATKYYGSWHLFTTLPPAYSNSTLNGTVITAAAWRADHSIPIDVNLDNTTYDIWVGISNEWDATYLYTTGHDVTSAYYNPSLHDCYGFTSFTLAGEDWVPFYGSYELEIRLYTGPATYSFPGNISFSISGSGGLGTEISLRGFYPLPGDMTQYTALGKSVQYKVMTNTTTPASSPNQHLFLTDSDGSIIWAFHSYYTLWTMVPVLYPDSSFSVFDYVLTVASYAKTNKDYSFYIGFANPAGWNAGTLDIQMLYDQATVLDFEMNGAQTKIYDDHDSVTGDEYYGVKWSYGTWTGTPGSTDTTELGSATGGTWGPSLGAQIDSATGISGASAIIGIFVIAIFSLMPMLITHTVPPTPLFLLFAGMGGVLAFGLGFFPLWLFFVAVIFIVIIIVYRLKSWIMTAWGGSEVTNPKKDSGVK